MKFQDLRHSFLQSFALCLTLTLFFNCTLSEDRPENEQKQRVNIILLGATGDLAKRYLWRGFFNLFSTLNENFNGTIRLYGSTRIDNDIGNKTLMDILDASIKCSDEGCKEIKNKFIKLCVYHRLKHPEDFEKLQDRLEADLSEKDTEIGRIFYLSVPPFAYEDISRNIAAKCRPKSLGTWVRVVLEKPFGSDLKTATELSEKLSKYWDEKEIYRIDHYLGKSGVEQIMEFKNMNRKFFEDVWNSDNIEQVKIVVKEQVDVEGRMGFYDHYGVVRDVFQNHLTEILVLVASEMSREKSPGNSRKVNCLGAVKQVTMHDAVFGQYEDYNKQLKKEVTSTRADSITPTFAAVLMQIQNKRWSGVPFLLVSGKSLDTRLAYVQIQFKQHKFCIKNNLDLEPENCKQREITFYIQGDKLKYPLTIISTGFPNIKFSKNWDNVTLDTHVSAHFKGSNVIMKPPQMNDAYSSLIQDVFLGNKNKFVSVDDLLLSWRIWNPLLESSIFIKPRVYSQDNLEDLDFEIIDGTIRFSSEVTSKCEKSYSGKYGRVDDGHSHTFRGNKLVSGSEFDVVYKLANDIASAIHMKVKADEIFHLALSGGSSPKKLFEVLSFMRLVPWKNVHIWLVDERCVNLSDDSSNFGNIYKLLLRHLPVPFLNIHPMPVSFAGELCQPGSGKQYEKLLRYHLNNNSLDFVVLGVGDDGHTASLFPQSSSLRSTNWVELTELHGGYARMTMTLALLNESKSIAVLVLGERKYDIVQKLMQGSTDAENVPITAVHPAHGSLTWYIDNRALSKNI